MLCLVVSLLNRRWRELVVIRDRKALERWQAGTILL